MSGQIIEIISSKLNIPYHNISNTIKLIKDGSTIPFISRYRKEFTGGMDEVQISDIKELYFKLIEIDKRKEAILKSIEEQNKLTDKIKAQIESCYNLSELEDIYLPFKPKRRTRASIAIENGLEPLAKIIMLQHDINVSIKAESFINDKVGDVEEVLKGARDIIAERVSENQKARNRIRYLFDKEAVVKSTVIKGKEEIGTKYSDYFNSEEELKKCPSHRLLAIRRGESEGILKVSIFINEDRKIIYKIK